MISPIAPQASSTFRKSDGADKQEHKDVNTCPTSRTFQLPSLFHCFYGAKMGNHFLPNTNECSQQ